MTAAARVGSARTDGSGKRLTGRCPETGALALPVTTSATPCWLAAL